jgi:hypothetical protein
MALDINIPGIEGQNPDAAAAAPKAAPKKAPQFDISSAPNVDLDALLAKIQQVKPESAGKGRSPSALAGKLAESVLGLVEKATAAKIAKLPLGPTVKHIAVALGVDAGKKSQYFYTLSQSVIKAIEGKVVIEKEGRSVFLICAGEPEAPATTE